MVEIKLRPQRITDAQRFFDILGKQDFPYFEVKPKSVEDELNFLKENHKRRKKNFEYNYSIIYDKQAVGGCGIKIDQHRTYIGEIGYFVDKNYWNKGIASKAIELLEKIAFYKLNLHRIEIVILPANKASIRAAMNNNYNNEGLQKQKVRLKNKYVDAFVLGKVKP